MKIKIIICVLLLIALCSASVAEDATQGNAAMILFNVTPSAFDDCHVFVSPLDQYGRAGTAFAILSRASIDSERRQDISMFQPVGFQHNRQYAGIDGNSIYHRCHLVGAQLTAGTACLENLVTGTQYLNIKGMLPIEDRARSYVTRTGDHLLYKVTPIYQGTELLPRAVEITLYSIESNGLRMTAYCYNIQPGYIINYATGAVRAENEPEQEEGLLLIANDTEAPGTRQGQPDYVLNVKSQRFHYPWCSGVETMSAKNRQDYYGDRQALIDQGYKPCGTCNP